MEKLTLPEHTKRLNYLRDLRKKFNHEFFWDDKYSDTDLSDKYGRWARLCFVRYEREMKDHFLLIGHINKVEGVFNFHTEFPVSGNLKPTFSDICNSSALAEEMIELLFIEFKDRILNPFK